MASPQLFTKPTFHRLMTVMLLLSLPSISFAADKHIDVNVYHDGTEYKLGFDNSECPNRPNDKGCVEADYGNSPMISWELNSDWELTRMQFSPDGQHWGDSGYPLKDCTVDDFGLSESDRSTGNASTANVVSNGKRLQIRDKNVNECTTHYKLFAQPRAGGTEINSDPVIENRGGSNP